MLEIKCPYCGKRSQNEFSYGGDASVKRPELNKDISDKEWDDLFILEKILEVSIQNSGIMLLDADNGLKF